MDVELLASRRKVGVLTVDDVTRAHRSSMKTSLRPHVLTSDTVATWPSVASLEGLSADLAALPRSKRARAHTTPTAIGAKRRCVSGPRAGSHEQACDLQARLDHAARAGTAVEELNRLAGDLAAARETAAFVWVWELLDGAEGASSAT